MNKEELFYVIRSKASNGVTIEQLAHEYNLDEFVVELIVENMIEPDNDNIVMDYDGRYHKCGTCGSPVDGDGVPDNCMGDCQLDDASYYDKGPLETEDCHPLELDFNE